MINVKDLGEITKKYGEITVSTPNQKAIKEMREAADNALKDGMERKEVNNLYEIYYYLKTGNYSGAWRKVNKLTDEIRWKVPKSVYDELKEVCKEMEITVY
jgi:hypothetical protein